VCRHDLVCCRRSPIVEQEAGKAVGSSYECASAHATRPVLRYGLEAREHVRDEVVLRTAISGYLAVNVYMTTKWTLPLRERHYFSSAWSWVRSVVLALSPFVEAFDDLVPVPAAILLAGSELGRQTQVLRGPLRLVNANVLQRQVGHDVRQRFGVTRAGERPTDALD